MLQKLAQWVKSLDPKSRTATAEVLGLLLILVITYAVGCEHGKHIVASQSSVTIDSPYAYESYHIDTVNRERAFTDTSSFRIKGTKLPNGHVAFHKSTKIDSVTTHTVDAEFDPATNELIGTLEAIRIVTVPIIMHTHTISTVIPVTRTVAAADDDDWTWFGIGSAAGAAVLLIGLLLLHLL